MFLIKEINCAWIYTAIFFLNIVFIAKFERKYNIRIKT